MSPVSVASWPPAYSLPLSSCCALCVWRVYWRCQAGRWYPYHGSCVGSRCSCTWMLRSTVGSHKLPTLRVAALRARAKLPSNWSCSRLMGSAGFAVPRTQWQYTVKPGQDAQRSFPDRKTVGLWSVGFFMDSGDTYGSFCAPAVLAVGPPFVQCRGRGGVPWGFFAV